MSHPVYELLITAPRLPEHVADRSDLADDLEAVIVANGGGEWLGSGSWFPLGPVDPDEVGAVGWEMEFSAHDPNRAAQAVYDRLCELGACDGTTVRQSGPVPKTYMLIVGGEDLN